MTDLSFISGFGFVITVIVLGAFVIWRFYDSTNEDKIKCESCGETILTKDLEKHVKEFHFD